MGLLIEVFFDLVLFLLKLVWEIFRALVPFGDRLPSAFPDDPEAQGTQLGTGDADDDSNRRAGSRGKPTRKRRGAAGHDQRAAADLLARLGRLRERSEDVRAARIAPVLDAVDGGLGQTLAAVAAGEAAPPDPWLLPRTGQAVGYLERMVQQRLGHDLAVLGDVDAASDALFAPVRAFLDAEDIPNTLGTPIVVFGEWPLSIDLLFRDLPLSAVRLPRRFERSVTLWPALAHELAHSLFHSVGGLRDEINHRLGLPWIVEVPRDVMEYGALPAEHLCGPWLEELFADALGVLQLGPAYGVAMRAHFAEPGEPELTRVVADDGGTFAPHPPADLRVRVAAALLDYLGRHAEASELVEAWEAVHGPTEQYLLPTTGDHYGGVRADYLLRPATEIALAIVQTQWESLSGFTLLDVPGLGYLHAEHARVQALVPLLSRGEVVTAGPRFAIAAAVLAVADGASEDRVMHTLRRSIVGVGDTGAAAARRRARAGTKPRQRPAGPPAASLGGALRATLRSRRALGRAVLLGAAVAPRSAPHRGLRR